MSARHRAPRRLSPERARGRRRCPPSRGLRCGKSGQSRAVHARRPDQGQARLPRSRTARVRPRDPPDRHLRCLRRALGGPLRPTPLRLRTGRRQSHPHARRPFPRPKLLQSPRLRRPRQARRKRNGPSPRRPIPDRARPCTRPRTHPLPCYPFPRRRLGPRDRLRPPPRSRPHHRQDRVAIRFGRPAPLQPAPRGGAQPRGLCCPANPRRRPRPRGFRTLRRAPARHRGVLRRGAHLPDRPRAVRRNGLDQRRRPQDPTPGVDASRGHRDPRRIHRDCRHRPRQDHRRANASCAPGADGECRRYCGSPIGGLHGGSLFAGQRFPGFGVRTCGLDAPACRVAARRCGEAAPAAPRGASSAR